MCGIAGIFNFLSQTLVSDSLIKQMCDVIPYRGPDGFGVYSSGPYGTGHRRLSIIDTVERSNQPMQTPDGEWVLTYNGEIYNFIELKAELIACGQEFITESDTEVLLKAFCFWGLDTLGKLNGMYAFAIWHKPSGVLTLARDRLGIKPLYYCETPAGICYASEIKSLLEVPGMRREVNPSVMDSYMSLGYCVGHETLFAGIKRLPPGHFLQVKQGSVTLESYWDMDYQPEADLGEAHYIEKAQSLLEDAVKLQLRSDVPLGVFLSGGVDSSAVVAMMSKLGVKDINTFSVAWDFGEGYDETAHARVVADRFDTKHHEFRMSPQNFLDFIPEYIWHMDEPVTEAAAISLYYIAKRAGESVTVVLSGEGADEVFGGYPMYRFMQWIEQYRKIPRVLRSPLTKAVGCLGAKFKKYANLSDLPLEDRYLGVSLNDLSLVRSLYTDSFAKRLSSNPIESQLRPYYEKTQQQSVQRRMQYLDLKTWLVDDLLIKADRMSMAASLELRVPFLDHRFLEFSANLPSHYRLKNGETKYLLKKALEPMLPDSILYRKKQGFPTPLSQLFKSDLKAMVETVLCSQRTQDRGYFKQEMVEQQLSQHFSGKADNHKVLWQLLVLELWHRVFIDGESLESLTAMLPKAA